MAGTAMVDPQELLAHPDNWRIHPDHQRKVMTGALAELGWLQHVTVSKRTKTILDGHLRVFLAKARGEKVPVSWVDLTAEEERKALASIDSLTQLADVDYEAMSRNLSQVETEDPDLAGLFDDMEDEANESLEKTKREDAEGTSNFKHIKRVFKERAVAIKPILPIADVELLERALEATGNLNRAEALTMLAKHYLETRGHGVEEARQHRTQLEDQLAADLAGALTS